MSYTELRMLNKTLKGEFAFLREVALIATDHETSRGLGVLLRFKIYIPGRKMLVGDFVLQETSSPTRRKVKYNELKTRIKKLGVSFLNKHDAHGVISEEEIEKICKDLVKIFTAGKATTFEHIMRTLEFKDYQLAPFTDSQRLAVVDA